MSDGAIFLLAIFLIVLRVLYMLATQKKIKVGPRSDHEHNPLDPNDPKNHGLMPGDVGYNPFDPNRN